MKGETISETAKRMEGASNTAPRSDPCQLAGKHRCGGPVTPSWGQMLCSVGWLLFSESDHNDTRRRVQEWIRIKGGTP